MTHKWAVYSVEFSEQGALVTFMDRAADVRCEGAVFMSRQLQVALDAYTDEIERLNERCVRFLRNVLDDYEDSAPLDLDDVPQAEDDDDDERGMGE